MSEIDSGDQQNTRAARNVRTRAAEWLERRVGEDWSEKDQSELDSWLAGSPTNRLAYLRVNAAWNQADRLAALHAPSSRNTASITRKGIFPDPLRVAVALIVMAVIGIAAVTFISGPREQIYATGIGGHRIVTLADGSHIELNTSTILRVALGSTQRDVFLDKGEAFFQIVHDSAHPFVVTVGDRRVIDLGTKFVVRRDTGWIEVALVEGRARFDRGEKQKQSQLAVLTPGDLLVATGNSISVTKNSTRELENELGWRHGVLIFYHTTLADAANEFNRYNRKKLVIADGDAARLRIDGTFLASNAELFGRVAHVVLGLHVQNLDNEVIISR
jgi:transmembrane sensor